MTPPFAAAVDPIILKVLALMDRVERNEVTSPEWERQSLDALFNEAEAHVTDAASWALAKYALVSWIDDLLIDQPWTGREWWESNSMEFAYFKTRDRATKFYVKAKEAAELARRDALEVFYICVVLGFRGFYNLREAQLLAGQLNLPMTIASWAKNTVGSLQLRQGRPPIREAPTSPSGAEALESHFLAVGAAVVTVVLSIMAATLTYMFFRV